MDIRMTAQGRLEGAIVQMEMIQRGEKVEVQSWFPEWADQIFEDRFECEEAYGDDFRLLVEWTAALTGIASETLADAWHPDCADPYIQYEDSSYAPE